MFWIFEDASLLKPASIFLMTFDNDPYTAPMLKQ